MGMLVLIGGLLVVSFLYYVSVMKKDEAAEIADDRNSQNPKDHSKVFTPDEGDNMECSQSIPKFVCSKCGSRTITVKVEEKVEEATTYETIEENNVANNYESFFHFHNYYRVPFPEAGVDIVDRKLKNTEESLEREINDYDSDNDDILTYTESWTENWLFRKKHNKSDSFKPVSMFVPNTTAKYRAMIGERNVDEISDFSECSDLSDEEFQHGEEAATRKVANGLAKYIYDQRSRVLLDRQSKHPEEYNITLQTDHLESHESNDISKRVSSLDGNDCNSNSTCTDGLQTPCASLDNQNTNSSETCSTLEADVACSLVEEKNGLSQESFNLSSLTDGIDVTHENAGNVQTSNRSYKAELFIETGDVNQNSLFDDKLSDIDFNLFSPPKPGTIADREHRKWQTAAPMENNPYSEENLQRRLLEKKYAPKYSSASSLLGMARINGLDDGKVVNGTRVIISDMDFETIDLPEEVSVSCNNTPIKESKSEDLGENQSNDNKTNVSSGDTRLKESKSAGMQDEDDTKNKSHKSKCSNSVAIKVTKKNATINEVDCSSADSHEEKISLPSVKKLVQVFSNNQNHQADIIKPKETNSSESEIKRAKFKRVERTQQSPRPLHLHSLTARSLSKEFREGLR